MKLLLKKLLIVIKITEYSIFESVIENVKTVLDQKEMYIDKGIISKEDLKEIKKAMQSISKVSFINTISVKSLECVTREFEKLFNSPIGKHLKVQNLMISAISNKNFKDDDSINVWKKEFEDAIINDTNLFGAITCLIKLAKRDELFIEKREESLEELAAELINNETEANAKGSKSKSIRNPLIILTESDCEKIESKNKSLNSNWRSDFASFCQTNKVTKNEAIEIFSQASYKELIELEKNRTKDNYEDYKKYKDKNIEYKYSSKSNKKKESEKNLDEQNLNENLKINNTKEKNYFKNKSSEFENEDGDKNTRVKNTYSKSNSDKKLSKKANKTLDKTDVKVVVKEVKKFDRKGSNKETTIGEKAKEKARNLISKRIELKRDIDAKNKRSTEGKKPSENKVENRKELKKIIDYEDDDEEYKIIDYEDDDEEYYNCHTKKNRLKKRDKLLKNKNFLSKIIAKNNDNKSMENNSLMEKSEYKKKHEERQVEIKEKVNNRSTLKTKEDTFSMLNKYKDRYKYYSSGALYMNSKRNLKYERISIEEIKKYKAKKSCL